MRIRAAVLSSEATTAADLFSAVSALMLVAIGREKKVLIEILRKGLPQPIVLDYRKDYDEED